MDDELRTISGTIPEETGYPLPVHLPLTYRPRTIHNPTTSMHGLPPASVVDRTPLPPEESGMTVRKRSQPRSRRRWIDTLTEAERYAFLAQSHIDVNCPCAGDLGRHDLAIAEDALDWAIRRISYANRERRWAREELDAALQRFQAADDRLEDLKRDVERHAHALQQLRDAEAASKVIAFPLDTAAGA